VGPGETFTAAIRVAAGEQELDSVQAFVDYDPTVLEAVGISGGGVLAEAYADIITPGKVDYAAVDTGGTASGTFKLATVTFQAKAGLVSGTPLTFLTVSPRQTKVKLGTTTLPLETQGGTVDISTTAMVVSIHPASQSVGAGETFTVAVRIAAGTQELDSVQAFVDYDTAYLEAVGISGGGVLEDVYQDISTPGEVDYAAVDTGGTATGTFTLATITFQAKAGLVSGTALTFQTTPSRETKLKLGTATLLITLVDGQVVIKGPPSQLTLTVSTASATVGDMVTLTATVEDALGQMVADGTIVTFATNLGAVGSKQTNKPTTDGVATATLQSTVAGTAHVTATAGSASDSAVVEFEPGPVYRVEVTPSGVTLQKGETQQFTATCYDAFDNESACTPLWSVADGDAGGIDGNGLFTAGTIFGQYLGAVVATSDGVTGTADVTVGVIDRILVSPVAVTLRPHETKKFTVICVNEYSFAVPCSVAWSVVDPEAGTVDATGLFTAGAVTDAYHTQVVAAAAGKTGMANVTVEPFHIFLPLVTKACVPGS
jgi:hypothetical protein